MSGLELSTNKVAQKSDRDGECNTKKYFCYYNFNDRTWITVFYLYYNIIKGYLLGLRARLAGMVRLSRVR
jgi:hypothetical protein